MKRIAAVLAVLAAAPLFAAEEKADTLATGEAVAPFYVADVTGPAAGEKLCYRCRYGDRPVVSIFVRDVDEQVATLVKEVDQKVGQNKEAGMAAFVVLLTENPEADAQKLKDLASKHNIQNVPLTTFDGKAGPPKYKLGQDTDVTVMMWVDSKLKVNDGYKKGELAQDKVSSVVGKTKEILN